MWRCVSRLASTPAHPALVDLSEWAERAGQAAGREARGGKVDQLGRDGPGMVVGEGNALQVLLKVGPGRGGGGVARA